MFLYCACFLLLGFDYVQAKEWRGIIPAHSSEKDVEKQIGKPNRMTDYKESYYELGEEYAFIEYDSGECGWWDSLKVPNGTVAGIHVILKTQKPIESFQTNISIYTSRPDRNLKDFVFYESDEGEEIETFRGKVLSVNYKPSKKDSNMRCYSSYQEWFEKKHIIVDPIFPKTYNLSLNFKQDKVDVYELISFEFYPENSDPGFRGYICISGVKNPVALAKQIKKYLVTARGIDGTKLWFFDCGGDRKPAIMYLRGYAGGSLYWAEPNMKYIEVDLGSNPKQKKKNTTTKKSNKR